MSNTENRTGQNSQIKTLIADLNRPEHQKAVLSMVNAYAMDPMANGKPLEAKVLDSMIEGLRRHPTTLIFLAYDADQPVGIAVCFLGFSTFYAKPLINIHDFAVMPSHRSQGVAKSLLSAVEQKAREMDCCKITLEVLENNHRAMKVYQAAGFAHMEYTEEAGKALFYAKNLA